MMEILTQQQATDLGKLRLKKFRDGEGRMVIEGERLVGDAMQSAAELQLLIVERGKDYQYARLLSLAEERGLPMCIAPTKLFEKLTDTRNPQGIAAVAALPSTDADEALRFASREHPLIALHGIADPGNLGTIIRTTDWFGGNALLISEDSVDPFNPKVVRSSMGSLFRVRIGSFPSLEWLLEAARSSGRKLTVTTAAGGIPPSAVSDPGSLIVVLGSEAHGLPSSIFASADMHVTIPGGGTESLNLAVSHAILQYAWHP